MNLILDIGNTSSKVALFEEDIMIKKYSFSKLVKKDLSRLVVLYKPIQYGIVCPVGAMNAGVLDFLKINIKKILEVTDKTKIPFENLYKTVHTLGKDRLAAIAGANTIYPHRNVLVIDMGTAITYDIINEKKQYIGGNISPGMEMRFRALHIFTQNLPLVAPVHEIRDIGESTESAIISGVLKGIILEIEGYIRWFEKKFSKGIIIFTGGDGFYFKNKIFFERKIKKAIFAEPDLVLLGLNRILQYNIQ